MLGSHFYVWRVVVVGEWKMREIERSPFIVLSKGGRYPHYLTPYQYAPYPWGITEAGDPWPKPMIGQWMEIVNSFLAVNDVKKPTFSSSFTSNRKTFWNTCAHTKELNFLLPYHLHPPLLSVGFGSSFGPCYARIITVRKNPQKSDT